MCFLNCTPEEDPANEKNTIVFKLEVMCKKDAGKVQGGRGTCPVLRQAGKPCSHIQNKLISQGFYSLVLWDVCSSIIRFDLASNWELYAR